MNNLKDLKETIKFAILSYEEPVHSWYAEQGIPKYSKETKAKVKEFQEEIMSDLLNIFSSHSKALCREAEERVLKNLMKECEDAQLELDKIYPDKDYYPNFMGIIITKIERLKHISKRGGKDEKIT